MNISVEQLQNTYVGVDQEDFKSLACKLISAFELSSDQNVSDSHDSLAPSYDSELFLVKRSKQNGGHHLSVCEQS